jgi:hypothetical protein
VKNIIILLILSSFILISGCYYDVADELYPEGSTVTCDTTVRGYAAKIQPMIGTNCAISGCHVPGAQTPDLSTHAEVAANADIVKEQAIINKTMPPTGPLPPCDILSLEQWINNGSQNN